MFATTPPSIGLFFACSTNIKDACLFVECFSFYRVCLKVLVGLGVIRSFTASPFFFIDVFVFRCAVVFVHVLSRSVFLSSLTISRADSMNVWLQDGSRCSLLVMVFVVVMVVVLRRGRC